MNQLVLPEEVAQLYQIVGRLERNYPGRPFTLDGHLVGSLGEVIAEKYFGLSLNPPGHPVHDARTPDGREVQVKLTGRKKIGIQEEPDFLLVLRIVDPSHGEVIYNGPGHEPWNAAGKMQKNGQRSLSISKLKMLNKEVPETLRIKERSANQ